MNRFRKLHMQIPTTIPATHANMVFRLLRHPSPMLQKLYLQVRNPDERDCATLGEAYQNIILGNAPNLKHAHLQILAGLKELQSVSLFKDLSALHLYFDSSTVIDGGILLGILHSSPCLRVLDILWSFLNSAIVCPMPSNYRIPLPCLQKLSLRGSFGVDNVNFVLERLDFPVDKVDFNITSGPNISDSTSLIHFLAKRRLSLFSISYSNSTKMIFKFFEKMDLGSPSPRPHSEESVFSIRHAPLDTSSNLLRKFKTSDITHMRLERNTFESAVLRSIFLLLENLQYLYVRHTGWNEDWEGPFPKSYLEALTLRVQHSNPQTEAALEAGRGDRMDSEPDDEASRAHLFPCPSLYTLELVSFCAFKESYIQNLVQCSKIREQAGHPFKSITICCLRSALAESAKAWLRTYELGCLHVEVTLSS